MSGIWINFINGVNESVLKALQLDRIDVDGLARLLIFWIDWEDDCTALSGYGYNVENLMSDIKQAIKNGDKVVEIDLEKYKLN